MQIDSLDIEIFSKCPNYYWFWRDIQKPSLSRRFIIIEDIIKKCHLKRTEYFKKAEWRVVLGWIDKEVFKGIEVKDKENYDDIRRFSESIIQPIQHWYAEYYKKDKLESFINVPLEYQLGSHLISANASIIKLDDIPVLTYINEKECTNLSIINNMDIRIKAWLLAKQFKLNEVYVEHFAIGPETVLGYNKVRIKKDMCDRMSPMLESLVDSISRRVRYPSRTSMCDGCQFRKDCFI